MNDTETDKLVRVKTYADTIGKSVTWVYKLIEKGELKTKEIDGIVFIVTG